MKFLIDNNLSYKLAKNLQADFPDTLHIRSALTVYAMDQEIWDYARKNGYVILTKDHDFDELSQLYGCPPKVVHLLCGNRQTNYILELLISHKKVLIEFWENDPENCLFKISI